MCDIEQMFYQFKVKNEDKDYLRFLWWKDGNYETEPAEFRMNVHIFGATSSPGCANFGLKQLATDGESDFGEKAAKFLQHDFYVDDGLKSVPSAEEAVQLLRDSQAMCAKGGVRLHKFVSNSIDVMKAIDPEDRASGIKNLDLTHDNMPIEQALGIHWCIDSDTFQFRITLKDQPLTRRGILSTVSSVYDPLGLIAPVILTGKRILQDLCKERLEWDDPLPDALRLQWEHWRGTLILLEQLKIDRCFKPNYLSTIVDVSLHHFSDASMVGYGQCSYLRLVDDRNQVHCTLVMAKARVTPLKAITIPRLELTAAVVSVHVSILLQKELEYDDLKEVFWTDSKVVLGYINNDALRFKIFVANRVQLIKDHTHSGQWKHIGTQENVADHASRGMTAKQLVADTRWFHGPAFLWNPVLPTDFDERCNTILAPNDPEVKAHTLATIHSTESHSTMIERMKRFSDWNRLKTAFALCMRLLSNLRNGSVKRSLSSKNGLEPLNVDELRKAEIHILKLVQQEAFSEDLRVLVQQFPANDFSKSDRQTKRRKRIAIQKSRFSASSGSVYRQGWSTPRWW